MSRPLSNDLRERAMARVAAGETIRADRGGLAISPSCVSKWSQRLRRPAASRRQDRRPQAARALGVAHAEWLRTRMRGYPFTLRGLVAELAERGFKSTTAPVWAFVHDEGLSFKKNRVRQRAGAP